MSSFIKPQVPSSGLSTRHQISATCPGLLSDEFGAVAELCEEEEDEEVVEEEEEEDEEDVEGFFSSPDTSASPFTFRFSAVFSREESLSWAEMCCA